MVSTQTLTSAEFDLFKDLVYQSCGIMFNDRNRIRLDHKVNERVDTLGLLDPQEYLKYLKSRSPARDAEIKILLDVLTVNETFFFRNLGHFDALANHIVPELVAKKTGARSEEQGERRGDDEAGRMRREEWNMKYGDKGRSSSSLLDPHSSTLDVSQFATLPGFSFGAKKRPKITVWSAGCSTGQEPYSIAMCLTEALGLKAREIDIQIYATDISETSLETAREGIYDNRRLESTDKKYLNKYFTVTDKQVKVKDEIKKLVTFMYGNLKENSFLSGLDIVLCRNVMIYFDQEMQKHIVEQFHRSLSVGGYLFIGHSESLQGLTTKFKFMQLGTGIVYRKS